MGKSGKSMSFDQLVEKTQGSPRERILDGLRFYGGESNAHQLRSYCNIPSKNYHFNKLEMQGLIETSGEEYVGKGGSAKIYHLTERGRKVVNELVEFSSGETATELQNRIEELENELERLGNLYNELADHVEVIDQRTVDN